MAIAISRDQFPPPLPRGQSDLIRRSPYLILDHRLNEGIIEMFAIIRGGRSSAWTSSEWVGEGKNAKPPNKTRFLMYPMTAAKSDTKVYWKNPTGHNSINAVGPAVAALRLIKTLMCAGRHLDQRLPVARERSHACARGCS